MLHSRDDTLSLTVESGLCRSFELDNFSLQIVALGWEMDDEQAGCSDVSECSFSVPEAVVDDDLDSISDVAVSAERCCSPINVTEDECPSVEDAAPVTIFAPQKRKAGQQSGTARCKGVKRVAFSQAEKLALVQRSQVVPKPSQKELHAWFFDKYGKYMAQGTLSGILRQKDALLAASQSAKSDREGQKKKARTSNVEDLEKQLYEWFLHMENRRAPLTDLVLLQSAKRIGATMSLPTNFNYSHKWLWDWKRRHSVKQQLRHGEGDDANEAGVDIARTQVPIVLKDVLPDLIYNFDETGLFFRQLPTRSLDSAHSKGRKGKKLAKDRLTVGLFVNATGTDKFAPIVIGTAKKPRCFVLWKPSDIGVTYFHNKTAWMSSEVFVSVMRQFNLHIASRSPGSKAYLLMDNAATHTLPHDALVWQSGQLRGFTFGNVVVVFLPPNTTSVVQPLDAGIIKAFKAGFRRRHVSWIVEELEGADDVQVNKVRPNVKQTIEWVRHAHREVSASTIKNCWRKAGILPSTATVEGRESEEPSDILDDNVESLLAILTRVDGLVEERGGDPEERLDAADLVSLSLEREIKDEPCGGEHVQGEQEAACIDAVDVDNIPPPKVTLHEARVHAASLAAFLSSNVQFLPNSARLLEDVDVVQQALQQMRNTALQRQATLDSWLIEDN